MRALEILAKRKQAEKLQKQIEELDAQIYDLRYDPSTVKELREFRRELQGEKRRLDADLEAEYARLALLARKRWESRP
jgi:uncharacterized protein YPO0396